MAVTVYSVGETNAPLPQDHSPWNITWPYNDTLAAAALQAVLEITKSNRKRIEALEEKLKEESK
jgi:hypothetical protein